MHNDQPLVSICIPCYNAEATILDTIQSVVTQTYTNIEIIITDNQSTDNTTAKVRAIEDPRIKLFVNPSNVGMSCNFEIAVSKASGKYIKMLCADDLITPDCIEKQVSAFLNNAENVIMVTAEKWVINEKGKKLFVKKFPGKQKVYEGIKIIKKSLTSGTNIFGEPGCILFRSDAITKAGGVGISNDFIYVFDLDLICRVLMHGNLYVIKEPLFFFRVIRSSFSAAFRWKQAVVFNKLIAKYTDEGLLSLSWFGRVKAQIMTWVMCIARNGVFLIVNRF